MDLDSLRINLKAIRGSRDLKVDYVKGWLLEHANGDDHSTAFALIDETEAVAEICVTGRELPEKTADALAAIIAANSPPRIFRHGGELARIEVTESGQPVISHLNESAAKGELARAAAWFTAGEKGRTPTSPPLEVVRDFLTMPGGWPDIPPIAALTESPVIRPDGTVLDRRGYDPATRLYYFPVAGVTMPPIPDTPTLAEVVAARDLLLELFCDFPFDGDASRANVLAALITPMVRPLITGPTPLCVIDKPQVGSGASLIATLIARVATGRPAAMMTAPRDPDEWRKTITSALLQGRGIVVIDNLEGSLYDSNLAAVLTATTYAARVLGTNEIKDVPNLATWIATGNNVSLGGDLPRRSYLGKIDPGVSRPWLRDPSLFRHPELETWTAENRGPILAAGLTIARAWIVAGRPLPAELPRLGGYESWVRVVGGILDFAGVKGFLGNLMELYERNDAETPAWAAFVAAWHAKLGDAEVTGAELLKALSEDSDFEAVLPIDPPHRDKKSGVIDDSGFTRRLGKALAARKGRIYPGDDDKEYQINLTGKAHSAKKWQVTEKRGVSSPSGATHDSGVQGEFGECETTPQRTRGREDMEGRVETNSPNSPNEANSRLETKLPAPTDPCPNCHGINYWLRPASRWGRAEWLCRTCTPPPEEGDAND